MAANTPTSSPSPSGKVRKEVLRVMVKLGLAQPYQPEFFAGFQAESRKSAEVVAPILLDLLKPLSSKPLSVVDVGCGTGTWLGAFAAAGVTDYLGLDGDYVNREQLQIPVAHFQPAELTNPLEVKRTFDLAISLEVAEHLPPEKAELFVANIIALAPAVYFGAAIPGQGGTGHLNEQWQSFWAGLFAKHGYVAIDAVRPKVWRDTRVSWWYSQNAILYVRKDMIERSPTLAALAAAGVTFDLAHPISFERAARKAGRKV